MQKENYLYKLWELIKWNKKDIYSIYFYSALNGILQLSMPLGIQAIIGYSLGATMVTSIYILIGLVVLGVYFGGAMQINQLKIIEKIQQTIFAKYAFAFAETIPNIDLKKLDKYYLPEKVNYFIDTLNIQKGFSKILLDIPTATITIVFGILLLSLYNSIFIVFGVVLVLILWLILRMTSKKGMETSITESKYKYEVLSWLEELARVVKSFKYSQGTDLNLIKLDRNVVGYLGSRTSHFNVLLIQYRALVLFKVLLTLSMLSAGTYLLINQQFNIGEFIAAEIVILSVISAVEKLIGSIDSVYDILTGLEKLSLVTEIPLEKNGNTILDNPQQGLNLQLHHVSFQYIDGTSALKNISIHIPSNTKACVSGNQGSGKSSLLRVMSGNFNDFEGNILINEVPLNNYNLESYRKAVGIYINNIDIFKGTLWENISLNRNGVAIEKVNSIAENIGLLNYILSLKNGYDTIVDPFGKKLPGTIAKKILLLRAICNEPRLLLLEEPWQGLEKTDQNKIVDYLLNKLPNTTVIVVSNDADFASKCNLQFILNEGKLL
jgi:ABC-type bacteriocin/lantibiotic exporter with double-glycine peptidase domain